ncbi:MAG: chemotaxis protein CheW [Gemmatimonadota bacterium]
MIPQPKFRSTTAYAARARSTAHAIERATFVTFTVGAYRFAAPVESIERVLRERAEAVVTVDGVARVQYRGLAVPVVNLAAYLGEAGEPAAPAKTDPAGARASSPSTRMLIVSLPTGWVAVAVDAVHEIATIDAAIITLVGHAPADPTQPAVRGALLPGVRGMFIRQEQQTLVLDIGRALGFRFT